MTYLLRAVFIYCLISFTAHIMFAIVHYLHSVSINNDLKVFCVHVTKSGRPCTRL